MGGVRQSASFGTQVVVLCNRTAVNLFRNPFLFWGHVASGAFIGRMLRHSDDLPPPRPPSPIRSLRPIEDQAPLSLSPLLLAFLRVYLLFAQPNRRPLSLSGVTWPLGRSLAVCYVIPPSLFLAHLRFGHARTHTRTYACTGICGALVSGFVCFRMDRRGPERWPPPPFFFLPLPPSSYFGCLLVGIHTHTHTMHAHAHVH